MKTSDRGVNLIKQFEGLRLDSYRCSAGVWTIGYGHTGPDVKEGQRITKLEADRLLRQDLERFENTVNNTVTVELNQNRFDALVSFTYNVGEEAFKRSTLVGKLNNGEIAEASEEFLKWNKAKGRELVGLTRRREAEQELFNQETEEESEATEETEA